MAKGNDSRASIAKATWILVRKRSFTILAEEERFVVVEGVQEALALS